MKTKIAAEHIHVERAINRIKQYALVGGVVPSTLWDIVDQLIFVAGFGTPSYFFWTWIGCLVEQHPYLHTCNNYNNLYYYLKN